MHKHLFFFIFICFFSSNVVCARELTHSKDQTFKSRFAKYGENKIYYQDGGKGKGTLIFIHGWGCNSTFWRAQINSFPGYRVLVIDLPGHGKSDKPKTNYTIEYFAQSIDSVMSDAGIKDALLVGHSLGAVVSRHFYRLYPKKVSGLIVIDAALQWDFYKKIQQLSALQISDPKTKNQQMVDRLTLPIKDASLKKEIRESMLLTPEYVATSASNSIFEEKVYEEDSIPVPVLSIYVKNPFWPANMEQSLRSFIPNLEFQMWVNASHFLMLEKSDEFNKAINEFLSKGFKNAGRS